MTVFDEMNRLFDEMRDTMFDSRFDVGYGRSEIPVRTETDDDGYVVHADLPGFEKSEIELRFDEGALTIDAHHEGSDGGETWARSVHEGLKLPGNVDEEEIEASYHNGVLEVRLPAEDAAEESGRRIDIE
ncbi:MAG: Hsp20/alpha crystallin family protein [Halobacteriota archaeon]|uniref:Hsp20/alpha crystallin family protein n=1 Tax=Natronomonas sp. TaxID=2184060 RepID=UPI0039763A79